MKYPSLNEYIQEEINSWFEDGKQLTTTEMTDAIMKVVYNFDMELLQMQARNNDYC